MKTKNLRTLRSMGLLMLATLVISLSGCATKKQAWGSLKKGMIMTYNFNPDKNLTYKNTMTFEQVMEVMGQEFTITADGSQVLSMKPIESQSNDLDYLVTIDEMSSKLSTPRGEMLAKVDDVIGKSFNLTISRLGEELDYSGAEAIIYDYGTGDTKSLSSDVQAFFPNLPDHPVKPGDTWESTDKVIENTSSGVLNMNLKNINTFEAIENINGYECMKINVIFTGIMEGKGEQDGMELITTGEISGIATWYFAFKEGFFVSNVAEGTGKTLTQVLGPQEMELPATRVFTMKSELVDM